ncbi:unnamed protein product [Calicophoron daubneyi]|uniref:Uncharacterized protein n=1 Tax=Calicophoron daubneyi TaxID=300641 RepID=A0AAV2TYL4_CALDB
MPVRVSRHVGRFLLRRIDQKRKLLEYALLELHDIENRLKMELLSLNTMAGADVADAEWDDDEPQMLSELDNSQDQLQNLMKLSDISPYELVDLNEEIGTSHSEEVDPQELINEVDNALILSEELLDDSRQSDPTAASNSSNPSPDRNQKDLYGHTVIPSGLRSRRGLNTTPDSSSSDRSSRRHKRGPPRCASTSPAAGDMPTSSSSPSRAPVEKPKRTPQTVRRRVNSYVREEEEENRDEDSQASDESSYSSPLTSNDSRNVQFQKRSQKSGKLALVITVSLLVFILMLWNIWTRLSPPILRSSPPPLSTKNLSAKFPGQSSRLWTQLLVTLAPLYKRRYFHSDADYQASSSPAVILLVNRKFDGPGTENSLFPCFVRHFGTFVRELMCQTLPDRPPLVSSEFRHELSLGSASLRAKSDSMKLTLDKRLKQLHDEGYRYFHFDLIDKLPSETVVLFHGVADDYNSRYPDSVIVFSLHKSFSHDLKADRLESRKFYSADGEFEQGVRRYLRSLWTPDLGIEETDALLSRLTRNIAVFDSLANHTETACPD